MDLDRIRARLAAGGNHSHTSVKFQDHLLAFATRYAGLGNCIVEVGCWRGGLSAQLAYTAKQLDQRFVVVDLFEDALTYARAAIQMAGASAISDFHKGDFQSYVAGMDSTVRPSLVFIDADHRYDSVLADVRALYSMPTLPFAAAFHDFSLRYTTPEFAGVHLALRDAFGRDFPHVEIGEIAIPGGTLRTIPAEDGHYHEPGCSEGVMIYCKTIAPIAPHLVDRPEMHDSRQLADFLF